MEGAGDRCKQATFNKGITHPTPSMTSGWSQFGVSPLRRAQGPAKTLPRLHSTATHTRPHDLTPDIIVITTDQMVTLPSWWAFEGLPQEATSYTS